MVYKNPKFHNVSEVDRNLLYCILQLINLGYTYISPAKLAQHRNDKSRYILWDIAFGAMRRLNPEPIFASSIRTAIASLDKVRLDDGMDKASELVYFDLLSGHAVTESVDGKKFSPQIQFIDWKNYKNNVFHLTPKFKLTGNGNHELDIVLFVNGIPFAVVQCKNETVVIEDVIQQLIGSQSETNRFFLFPQLLIASNGRFLKYATTSSDIEHYTIWKEQFAGKDIKSKIESSIHTPIDEQLFSVIENDFACSGFTQYFERCVCTQDEGVYNLLNPARLLDIVKNFIIYGNKVKKIANCQQYFTVNKAVQLIKTTTPEGVRKGGVILHPPGCDKILTMLMLIRAIAETVQNSKLIVVTDRRSLDKEISHIFSSCNIKQNVHQTVSVKDLVTCIKEKSRDVLTVLVQKFDAVQNLGIVDSDPNIFIIIDDINRPQRGLGSISINKAFPNACRIAFTTTPLPAKDKDIISRSGSYIDIYSIAEARADEIVVPLVYQKAFIKPGDQPDLLNIFYERVLENFPNISFKEFEKKASSALLNQTLARTEVLALKIHDHYVKYFKDSGLKAKIIVPSKYAAIVLKYALDLLGGVSSEVLIGETSIDGDAEELPERKSKVTEFLKAEKSKYGSLEIREKVIIKDFKDNPGGCEIVLVVDKSLGTFEVQRDTVLYLARCLTTNSLLQMLASISCVFSGDPGKPRKINGLIIDYSKNSQNIKHAIELFPGYDLNDVDGVFIETSEIIQELLNTEKQLQNIFKPIDEVKDNFDACVTFLIREGNSLLWEEFHGKVIHFLEVFFFCLTLDDFYKHFSDEQINNYRKVLRHWGLVSRLIRGVLADNLDYSKYRHYIYRVLDRHTTLERVEKFFKSINILDVTEFEQFMMFEEFNLSKLNQAKAILGQTNRMICEYYQQDPEFYGEYAEKVQALLTILRDLNVNDASVDELLAVAKDYQASVVAYDNKDIPGDLKPIRDTYYLYRNLKPYFREDLGINSNDEFSNIILFIHSVISKHRIVEWYKNIEVEKAVTDELTDYFYGYVRNELGGKVTADVVTSICEKVWRLAVENACKE